MALADPIILTQCPYDPIRYGDVDMALADLTQAVELDPASQDLKVQQRQAKARQSQIT